MVYALSRRNNIDESISLANITFPNPICLEELKVAYKEYPLVQQKLTLLQGGSFSTSSFILKYGILFKNGRIYILSYAELKFKIILYFVHASSLA